MLSRGRFISGLSLAGAGFAAGGCLSRSWRDAPDLRVGLISDVHVPIAGPDRIRLALSLFDRSKTDETSAQCLVMDVWPDSVVFERWDARQNCKIADDWER